MTSPIGITMGDPAGIGPEIIAKMYASGIEVPCVVIGDEAIMRRAVAIVQADLQVAGIDHPRQARFRPRTIEVVRHSRLDPNLPFGRVDRRAGQAAYDYVERAIEYAKAGAIRAIVTAPINKEAMQAAGKNYPGHTEILAEKSGTREFAMMLASDELRVLLVTIHIPLAEVIGLITGESELRAIRLAHQACCRLGIARPRIGVAGLNPHASENGLFGREDRDIIAPAIEQARRDGIEASGPWPGDTVFMRARRGEFDIVVAQYHDQGLIPIKYLGLESGVNITVGLPFVRTSVDHGTAFDIAGTGRADHGSLKRALEQAAAMTRLPGPAAPPIFIFMLTRQDATVPDWAERLPEGLAAGVRHIGFKDVGLPMGELRALAQAIRADGATSYLEVVSLDEDAERKSALAARELGVDCLLGGMRPDIVLPIIRGTSIRYYPYAGRIVGHPSSLVGSIEEIVSSARHLTSLDGVHGIDLLAYRFEGDVPLLIRRVCEAVDKPVFVAGSIDSAARIDAVVEAGAAGFTIGTAALDGVFPAEAPGLTRQLASIEYLLVHSFAARAASTKDGQAA